MKPAGTTLPHLVRRGVFALLGAALLLPLLAFAPKAEAQVSFNVQIGAPPVCPYGYYEYPPYSCAAPGFYGPGYFYNGIFLGVGPWANWGYAHGWGARRFYRPGGGRYYSGYWRHHEHLRPDHRWDHPRGNAYGYYAHHDRDHYERHDRGHYDRDRGHQEHRENGRHEDHGNGHGEGHGNGHGNGHGHDH